MVDAEEQIREALAGYGDETGGLAEALRVELKRETLPAFELAGYSAQSCNIGYGFTTTWKGAKTCEGGGSGERRKSVESSTGVLGSDLWEERGAV